METFLVAADGSAGAMRAVASAAELARALGAKLLIAHVVPRYDAEPALPATESFEQVCAEHAQRVLAAASDVAHLPPEQLETRLLFGASPAEALASVAENEGCRLVVTGCRGQGAVRRMLLGSVSGRLLELCARPVLVVH